MPALGACSDGDTACDWLHLLDYLSLALVFAHATTGTKIITGSSLGMLVPVVCVLCLVLLLNSMCSAKGTQSYTTGNGYSSRLCEPSKTTPQGQCTPLGLSALAGHVELVPSHMLVNLQVFGSWALHGAMATVVASTM